MQFSALVSRPSFARKSLPATRFDEIYKSTVKIKKYIGQIVSFKLKDRKELISGYIIDYNDDWTLLKFNPVDYIIDGYVILRNNNIKAFCREEDEKWREKVINLKGLKPNNNDLIPLTNLENILTYLTDKFGIFQVYKKSGNACYLGRLKSIESEKLVMDDIDTKGKWTGKLKLKTIDISVIEFDTDYINSLKLILKTKKLKQE